MTADGPLPANVTSGARVHQRVAKVLEATPLHIEEQTFVDGAMREDRRLVAVAATDIRGILCKH